MSRIKLYFIGTSGFAVPSLNALHKDVDFEIVGVITQPDKKAGRDMKTIMSPVKLAARKLGLPVWQPVNISDFVFPPNLDLIIVAAYGQMIPDKILGLPKHGCINVHGSLLPKYRGASCVQAPILADDQETGISIVLMTGKLDAGPIIAQEKTFLDPDETAGSLYEKLSNLAGDSLPSIIKYYVNGRLKPRTQAEEESTYAKKIKKTDARIDWSYPAVDLEKFVRAMHPWPGAFSTLGDSIIKIIEVGKKPLESNNNKPGILITESGKLYVQCGKNALALKLIQLPGKKPITGEDLINGYPQYIGQILV